MDAVKRVLILQAREWVNYFDPGEESKSAKLDFFMMIKITHIFIFLNCLLFVHGNM